MDKYAIEGSELINNYMQPFRMIRIVLFLFFSCMLYAHADDSISSESIYAPHPEAASAEGYSIRQEESQQVNQQSSRVNITGKVTAAFDDEPLPGVNVVIAGTTQGTTTDIDGVYELLAQEGDNSLPCK